nr:LPXTG cell wall anchor domain-containing protein [Planctomonas sp. JC2975]
MQASLWRRLVAAAESQPGRRAPGGIRCPYAGRVTHDFGALAATGSDVTPWLIVAGIIVLLGVIALVVAGIVRSRRAERQVENAAEAVADAGGTLPEPDPNASASDETVLDEAADLNAADAAAAASGDAAASSTEPPAGEPPTSEPPASQPPSDGEPPRV